MVGSGDRSEKIRTYDFPQSRVTDHRIDLTLHQLQQDLDGDLDMLVEPLSNEDQARRLLGGTRRCSVRARRLRWRPPLQHSSTCSG